MTARQDFQRLDLQSLEVLIGDDGAVTAMGISWVMKEHVL